MKSYKRHFRDWIERRLGVSIFRSSDLPHGLLLTQDLPKLGINPTIIFDVGAYIGSKTVEFSNEWPNSTIFAFETVTSSF